MGIVHDDEIAHELCTMPLKCASFLCLIFLIAEIVGGIISGSLAVLSDAAHLSSDLMSFLFAVGASHLAAMKGSARFVSTINMLSSSPSSPCDTLLTNIM